MSTPRAVRLPLADADPRRLEDALGAALREVLAASGGEAGVVLLRTRAGDRVLVRAPVGLEPPTERALAEFCARGLPSLTNDVLRDGRARIEAPDAHDGSSLGPIFAAAGYRAWALAPVDAGGGAAGILHLLARGSGLRVPVDGLADLARGLAPLATALRWLEIANAVEARRDVVAQVAQGLLSHVELDALFPELIRLVCDLCPCDGASVAVRRPELGAFELVAVYAPGVDPGLSKGARAPEGETAVSLAWRGEVVQEPETAKSRFPSTRALAARGIASTLYIPIGDPERRGVLIVGRARPGGFSEDEVSLHRSIVPYLEIALRNAEHIGRMRAAYRELQDTQERLVRAERLRALGELAAGVAHEIGNALAVVDSHAELLGRRLSDPELAELVRACRQAVAHADRSVTSVLDLARSAPVHLESVEPRRARLDRIVAEILEDLSPRWRDDPVERPGIRYAVDATRVVPVPEAAVDPVEARNAVRQLVANALEALPRGGRVALATVVEDDQVLVSVDDDGPGIAPGAVAKVFEPFFSTKGGAHAGLGLATVARLARSIGGSVRVTASPLGGARFELRIPCQELGSGRHELPHSGGSATPPPRSVSVLLVEDEPALRQALPQLLALRGYAVQAVADVASALAVLDREPVQVVVTDLGLPGRSGWELVDAVREKFPETRIIVLSGWGALTDPSVARERGVAAILAKPTSEKDLARTIELVVAERRAPAPGAPT